MKTTIPPLTTLTAWKALEAHYKKIRKLHLRRLFAEDPQRGERLTAEAVGMYLDYSKNRITDETVMKALHAADLAGQGRWRRPANGEFLFPQVARGR